jgi:hypothetical protein
MPSASHPSQFTPEERARRVAALLATGLLRLGNSLLQPTSLYPPAAEKPSESGANPLAVSPEKSVTVTPG